MNEPTLLVYQRTESEPENGLLALVGRVHQGEVRFCRNLTDLATALNKRTGQDPVVLFLVTDSLELDEVTRFRSVFRDVGLVFVLPDRDETTRDKALALRPRYFAYHDEDFEEVTAVVARMLSKSKGPKSIAEVQRGQE